MPDREPDGGACVALGGILGLGVEVVVFGGCASLKTSETMRSSSGVTFSITSWCVPRWVPAGICAPESS